MTVPASTSAPAPGSLPATPAHTSHPPAPPAWPADLDWLLGSARAVAAGWVRRLACRFRGVAANRPHEVDDYAQEAALALCRASSSAPDGLPPEERRRYLVGSALNRLRDLLRGRVGRALARESAASQLGDDAPGLDTALTSRPGLPAPRCDPAEAVERGELAGLLHEAFETLRQQDAVLYLYADGHLRAGLCAAAIARRDGVHVRTAQRQLTRALGRLRELLGEEIAPAGKPGVAAARPPRSIR